jgi:hypothetical protein
MFRKVTLLVLMLSGCGFTLDVDIEGIEKIDALLDGGISIHIDGIPDGGILTRVLPDPSPKDTDDAGK